MLHVITKGGREYSAHSYNWSSLPGGSFLARLEDPAVMVMADGPEYSWLLNNFKYIPHVTNMGICVWTGELAQFIYINLPRR